MNFSASGAIALSGIAIANSASLSLGANCNISNSSVITSGGNLVVLGSCINTAFTLGGGNVTFTPINATNTPFTVSASSSFVTSSLPLAVSLLDKNTSLFTSSSTVFSSIKWNGGSISSPAGSHLDQIEAISGSGSLELNGAGILESATVSLSPNGKIVNMGELKIVNVQIINGARKRDSTATLLNYGTIDIEGVNTLAGLYEQSAGLTNINGTLSGDTLFDLGSLLVGSGTLFGSSEVYANVTSTGNLTWVVGSLSFLMHNSSIFYYANTSVTLLKGMTEPTDAPGSIGHATQPPTPTPTGPSSPPTPTPAPSTLAPTSSTGGSPIVNPGDKHAPKNVGVIVGCTLAGVIIVGIVVAAFLYRKRKRTTNADSELTRFGQNRG
eukprot:Phypoly_transcript_10675.p1 GENE.Phypoly_transcript_10675~~Phypoly_transcript_10675.p1  ORF type:complete len:412 (+),score=66.17 Phypoly_transcript_10675:89-1237(+)